MVNSPRICLQLFCQFIPKPCDACIVCFKKYAPCSCPVVIWLRFWNTRFHSNLSESLHWLWGSHTLIAKFMGPTWGPPGSCRPHVGPMNFAIWDAIASVPVKQSWGIWVNKLHESNNNDSNNNKMMHTETLCINHGTYCTLQRWHYPYCRQNTCCYSLPRHYLNSADVSSIRPNRTGSSVNFIKIYLFPFKEMLLKVALVLSLSSWCLERWRRGGRFLEPFY